MPIFFFLFSFFWQKTGCFWWWLVVDVFAIPRYDMNLVTTQSRVFFFSFFFFHEENVTFSFSWFWTRSLFWRTQGLISGRNYVRMLDPYHPSPPPRPLTPFQILYQSSHPLRALSGPYLGLKTFPCLKSQLSVLDLPSSLTLYKHLQWRSFML